MPPCTSDAILKPAKPNQAKNGRHGSPSLSSQPHTRHGPLGWVIQRVWLVERSHLMVATSHRQRLCGVMADAHARVGLECSRRRGQTAVKT